MNKCILPATLLLCTHLVFSQNPNTILVKAGDDAGKVISWKDRYRYSEFLDGQLYYPQGKKSEVLKLNYNLLYGAMQFLTPKGDTLFIAPNSNIFKYIQIQRDLYYHHFEEGYFEILTKEHPIKLAAQLKWKLARKESNANNGYGNISSASDSESSARFSSDTNTFVANENSVYAKELAYYLLGEKDKIYKANKGIFLKLFSDHKQEIQLYLKEENIDFLKEEDLKKLLEFCMGLENV